MKKVPRKRTIKTQRKRKKVTQNLVKEENTKEKKIDSLFQAI